MWLINNSLLVYFSYLFIRDMTQESSQCEVNLPDGASAGRLKGFHSLIHYNHFSTLQSCPTLWHYSWKTVKIFWPRRLVAGCGVGHIPRHLHVRGWFMGQIKKIKTRHQHKMAARVSAWDIFGFIFLGEGGNALFIFRNIRCASGSQLFMQMFEIKTLPGSKGRFLCAKHSKNLFT